LASNHSNTGLKLRLHIAYGNALISAHGYTAQTTIGAFTRARELAASTNEAPERFSAYYGLWATRSVRGEVMLMREVAEAFLTDAQRCPGSQEICVANRLLGCSYWAAGDYIPARTHLEKAVASYDPIRDRALAFRFGQDLGVAAKVWLAVVLGPLGEIRRGKGLLKEAVRLAEEGQHAQTMCFAHAVKCLFEAVNRDPPLAMPHAATLVSLGREHGMWFWLALGTFFFGWARVGSDPGGEKEMRDGLARLNEMDVHLYDPLGQTLIAEVEARADRISVALERLSTQLATNERTGQHWLDAEMYRVLGELILKEQPLNLFAAEAAFLRAIEIAKNQQALTFVLRASLSMAKLFRATGRDQAAHELLVQALPKRERPDLPEFAEGNRLLGTIKEVSSVVL
jgi:tetratricopeptide (TPR) repeat protein